VREVGTCRREVMEALTAAESTDPRPASKPVITATCQGRGANGRGVNGRGVNGEGCEWECMNGEVWMDRYEGTVKGGV
jgi:hypothetical protein